MAIHDWLDKIANQRRIHLIVAVYLHGDFHTVVFCLQIARHYRAANTLVDSVPDDADSGVCAVLRDEVASLFRAAVVNDVNGLAFAAYFLQHTQNLPLDPKAGYDDCDSGLALSR